MSFESFGIKYEVGEFILGGSVRHSRRRNWAQRGLGRWPEPTSQPSPRVQTPPEPHLGPQHSTRFCLPLPPSSVGKSRSTSPYKTGSDLAGDLNINQHQSRALGALTQIPGLKIA